MQDARFRLAVASGLKAGGIWVILTWCITTFAGQSDFGLQTFTCLMVGAWAFVWGLTLSNYKHGQPRVPRWVHWACAGLLGAVAYWPLRNYGGLVMGQMASLLGYFVIAPWAWRSWTSRRQPMPPTGRYLPPRGHPEHPDNDR